MTDISSNVSPLGFAWSPIADVLAVLIRNSAGVSRLSLVRPGGDLRLLPVIDEVITSFEWSPDGKMIAYVTTSQTPSPHDVVKTVSTTGAPSVQQFEAPPITGVTLAGWWPNGKGMLFWLRPHYSQSLAADGLLLYSKRLDDAKPRPLVTTLLYRDWLAWTPSGQRVLLVEGSGREVWKDKSLTLCDPQAGACRRLRQRSDAVSLDPAWASGGRGIAFIRAKALSGLPDAAEVRRWTATLAVWLAAPDGTDAREVVQAGRGVARPMWSASGHDLLFWRAEALWLLNMKTNAVVKIVEPFPTPPSASPLFGHMSWRDLISWHRP